MRMPQVAEIDLAVSTRHQLKQFVGRAYRAVNGELDDDEVLEHVSSVSEGSREDLLGECRRLLKLIRARRISTPVLHKSQPRRKKVVWPPTVHVPKVKKDGPDPWAHLVHKKVTTKVKVKINLCIP